MQYCMKLSGMCLHIYSLPPSAFLKYQTRGFYCTCSKSHPLSTFEHLHFAKFHFHIVFFREYWTGHRYFIHKKELYCTLDSKKKSIADWHLFITQMETKWTKWYAMTCNCILIVRIAFRYAYISF